MLRKFLQFSHIQIVTMCHRTRSLGRFERTYILYLQGILGQSDCEFNALETFETSQTKTPKTPCQQCSCNNLIFSCSLFPLWTRSYYLPRIIVISKLAITEDSSRSPGNPSRSGQQSAIAMSELYHSVGRCCTSFVTEAVAPPLMSDKPRGVSNCFSRASFMHSADR